MIKAQRGRFNEAVKRCKPCYATPNCWIGGKTSNMFRGYSPRQHAFQKFMADLASVDLLIDISVCMTGRGRNFPTLFRDAKPP